MHYTMPILMVYYRALGFGLRDEFADVSQRYQDGRRDQVGNVVEGIRIHIIGGDAGCSDFRSLKKTGPAGPWLPG
jgi:hypothetical protein